MFVFCSSLKAHIDGVSLATDSLGNVYLAGSVFGHHVIGNYEINVTTQNCFVAKFDPLGECIWLNISNTTGIVSCHSLSLDSDNNCYLSGMYRYTVVFDTITLVSSGNGNPSDNGDIFVAKLDKNGKWEWAKSAGDLNYDCSFTNSVDKNGNCYIGGYYYGDPKFGEIQLSGSAYSKIFIAKLNTKGNWIWAISLGDEYNYFNCYDMVYDKKDNLFITGFWDDQPFVAQIDTNGSHKWTEVIESTGFKDLSHGIDIDSEKNIYITGNFSNNIYFGDKVLASSGYNDIYVAKMDSNKQWLWALSPSGSVDEYGTELAVDNEGLCYLVGDFSNELVFGEDTLKSGDNDNSFYAIIDNNGNWSSVKQIHGNYENRIRDIVIDDRNKKYFTGYYYLSASIENIKLTSQGVDFFLGILDETNKLNKVIATGNISVGVKGENSEKYLNNLTAYPNPFDLNTIIHYTLNNFEHVKLVIYNSYGKCIKVLVDNYKNVGTYELFWNGKDTYNNEVAKGVYFCTLISNGKLVKTQKIVKI